MPTVLREKGFRFFFFSGEGREPAHIHVEHAGQYAKYWLEPVRLARSRGLRGHELSEIHRLVETNKTQFTEKWHEFFGR